MIDEEIYLYGQCIWLRKWSNHLNKGISDEISIENTVI